MQCFFSRESFKVLVSLSAPLLARQRRRLSRCHHGCWSCDGGGSSFSLIAGLSNYKRGHHLWWIDTNRWIWGSLPMMVNSSVNGFPPQRKRSPSLSSWAVVEVQNCLMDPPFFLEKRILLYPEESKVIQIDGFPITKTKRGVAYPSLDPCTFFFSVFHSKEVLFVCFVGCQVWKFFDFLGERSRREQGNPPAAMVLSVYWPSCGLDSRLLGMVRISCHCQWSVDYFQWNAFVIVIIVVARCCCCCGSAAEPAGIYLMVNAVSRILLVHEGTHDYVRLLH